MARLVYNTYSLSLEDRWVIIYYPKYNSDMSTNNDVVMGSDVFNCLFQDTSDSYNKAWGCSLVYNTHGLRTPFMSLSDCKESYAKRMKRQNDMIVEKDPVVISNSVSSLGTQVELEYATSKS